MCHEDRNTCGVKAKSVCDTAYGTKAEAHVTPKVEAQEAQKPHHLWKARNGTGVPHERQDN